MQKRAGFTLIELLITISVMLILMTLAVVSVRSTQANGRDAERKADIEMIGRALEQRYTQGNSLYVVKTGEFTTGLVNAYTLKKGTYPNKLEFVYGIGYSKGEFNPGTPPENPYMVKAYPGLTKAALLAPSGLQIEFICHTSSCNPAGDTTQIENSMKVSGNWIDRYIYEPVARDGTICGSADWSYPECPAFNLYWRSEVEQAVKVYKSKNR